MPTKTRKRSVRQARVREKSVPAPSHTPVPTTSYYVPSGADILNSAAKIPVDIPEMPRNGKPARVYVRQPSARAMMDIFGEEDAKELRAKLSSREVRDHQTARMIAGLVEDGQGNRLFTLAQAEYILDAHYVVFQRLAEAINEAFRSAGDDTDKDADTGKTNGGEDENPFVQTDSSN